MQVERQCHTVLELLSQKTISAGDGLFCFKFRNDSTNETSNIQKQILPCLIRSVQQLQLTYRVGAVVVENFSDFGLVGNNVVDSNPVSVGLSLELV